jgi:hypothetical protein
MSHSTEQTHGVMQMSSETAPRLGDISFDENDLNLFQVDDLRLRADALRHSVLPKLHVVLHKCLSMIRDIYGIEALDNSRIGQSPSFRTRRENELKLLYTWAAVWLSGKANKGLWNGFGRKDGKPVQALPFLYQIYLEENGMTIHLQNYWLKGLDRESNKKVFDFILEYEPLIHMLCYYSGMRPIYSYELGKGPITPLRDVFEGTLESGFYLFDFSSVASAHCPVKPDRLQILCEDYVSFFPVYDSYLQIAMGKLPRFTEMVEKLNRWLAAQEQVDQQDSEGTEATRRLSSKDLMRAREAAEQKVKVRPSVRWQVFARDNWKCRKCGRGAQDGIILQVDHIVPRSKGGKDKIDNYQTLCHICNLGKGNKKPYS